MTSPATTDPATVDDSDVTAAASPALGADSGREATAIPAPAAPSVGDVPSIAATPTSVGTYRDSSGRVHYASPQSKATRQNLAAGAWSEVDPAELQQPAQAFDPTQHPVKDVLAYLAEHADDGNEVARVQAVEAQAGRDRVSIRDWAPEA